MLSTCVKNKRGPNTKPCGTPDTTGIDLEVAPFTTNLCLRFVKQLRSHDNEWEIFIITLDRLIENYGWGSAR